MQSYINPREREMDKLVQIAKIERAKVSLTQTKKYNLEGFKFG